MLQRINVDVAESKKWNSFVPNGTIICIGQVKI